MACSTYAACGQAAGSSCGQPKAHSSQGEVRPDGTASGVVTLDTGFTVDRAQFEMGWNQLGMMRGLAVTASLRFTRAAG